MHTTLEMEYIKKGRRSFEKVVESTRQTAVGWCIQRCMYVCVYVDVLLSQRSLLFDKSLSLPSKTKKSTTTRTYKHECHLLFLSITWEYIKKVGTHCPQTWEEKKRKRKKAKESRVRVVIKKGNKYFYEKLKKCY